MGYNILIVEDQKEISDILVKYIEKEGNTSEVASNGFEALEKFRPSRFHLVLLDIMMPGINGFEVIEEIRKLSDVPVIFLTAKESETDRIKGFDMGADDYVVKPFSTRELMRRIQAVLKRVYPSKEKTIKKLKEKKEKKLFVLDKGGMKFYKEGKEIELTATEFALMDTFLRNKSQILSREQLIRLSFGEGYEGYDRNIDSYIKRLRQKIEDQPQKPRYLKTKYGAGYIFEEDDK